MRWTDNVRQIHTCLNELSARTGEGQELRADEAFASWAEATRQVREDRRSVYLAGNGASASMASHVAADLAKNAFVHTEVFSDLSLITAIANDISFDEVFAEPLRRRMEPGDMLVVISSSGESPNILRAVEEAGARGGWVATLSAMGPENTLRGMGDLNLYVPADTYGHAESCHATILHHWIDAVAGTAENHIPISQLRQQKVVGERQRSNRAPVRGRRTGG